MWEGGKPVVTFPIPGVPGATATATLDAKFMAEKVVVKDGTNTTEFTYSDYRDWNNPLHPAEAFVAGRMTERRNGTVVRDITTTLTETGQMYVVMPVPASVKAAIKPTLQPPNWVSGFAQRRRQRRRRPCRDAEAGQREARHDGCWRSPGLGPPGGGNRRCGPTQTRCKVPNDNFVVDYAWISPSRYGPGTACCINPNTGTRSRNSDMWTNKFDPVMTCQPMGIPRQAPSADYPDR